MKRNILAALLALTLLLGLVLPAAAKRCRMLLRMWKPSALHLRKNF